MNIHDVLEYGPVVAGDEETGILITVNGAYFNVWAPINGDWNGWTEWANTEAFDMRSRVTDAHSPIRQSDGLYGLHITDVMDAAAELLATILQGDDDDE